VRMVNGCMPLAEDAFKNGTFGQTWRLNSSDPCCAKRAVAAFLALDFSWGRNRVLIGSTESGVQMEFIHPASVPSYLSDASSCLQPLAAVNHRQIVTVLYLQTQNSCQLYIISTSSPLTPRTRLRCALRNGQLEYGCLHMRFCPQPLPPESTAGSGRCSSRLSVPRTG